MPSILCYGDSNTWGSDPATGSRFGYMERWPGVLRAQLGDGYEVVEEGQSGRTTVWDHPIYEHRNGRAHIVPILESHVPLDLVIVLLGTNDLNPRFARSAAEVAQGAGQVARIAQGYASEVLLVAPPPFAPLPEGDEESDDAVLVSRGFAEAYRQTALSLGCAYFDAGSVIESSPLDGVHWEAASHRVLGEQIAAEVKRILGEA